MITPDVWTVAFWDPPRPRWWGRFLTPGFRHCCAFGYMPRYKLWVVYDWSVVGIGVMVSDADGIGGLVGYMAQHGGCFVDIKARGPVGPVPAIPRMPLYCVTATAHLVGIGQSFRGPWTPLALYRALRARGGTPSFRETVDQARCDHQNAIDAAMRRAKR